MHRLRLLLAFTWFVSTLAMADGGLRFEDYAVRSTFTGHAAKVRLADAESRKYATMLRSAASRKADFAGHYVLASWGCGASCVMAATVDLKTGDVTWLPFTVCCWNADVVEPLTFRLDSRLLIVRGSRNEAGPGTYYYEFDGKQFVLVDSKE